MRLSSAHDIARRTSATALGTGAFLCSAAADQITGTATSVDGGWTAK